MNKLNIQDLSKLKITSIKSWSVNFIYDNEQYFLHDDFDEDRCLGLYHKTKNGNECIISKATLSTICDYIKMKANIKFKWGKYDKCNITYSQINKKYFVKKLTYDGFVDSCYNEEIEKIKEQININNKRIKELESQINEIRKMNKNLILFKEG